MITQSRKHKPKMFCHVQFRQALQADASEIMLRSLFLRNPTFPGWLLGYAGIGRRGLSARPLAR
jgi:hypothetical protein